MKQTSKEIELNHSALDLYKIVLDIEKYPDYIPWCSKIEILTKNKNQLTASMIVNYSFFPSQKFTSKVAFDSKKKIINTKYIKGPLKDLFTEWSFLEIDKNKTKVILNAGFEFNDFIHQKIALIFFPLIEDKMIKSFIKRAEVLLN
jgi:coenzyme Q-binding protein COQ10